MENPPLTTAGDIASRRVVEGLPDSRLADVAAKIKSAGAHHCAVVDDSKKFVGLIRLGDVAGFAQPGNRILADLVSPVPPLTVRATEPAASVAALFGRHQLTEAVVLTDEDDYAGLVTAESVMAFVLLESTRKDEALAQTRSRLDAAMSAKDVFLRSLSHELRTPLNPVLLVASEGASDMRLPKDVREQFELIATHASLEAHLIDGLLDAARIDKGTLRLEREPVDLRGVIERVAGEFAAPRPVPFAQLVLELGMTPSVVDGDGGKLEQALRSLFRCALESSQAGESVRVHIRADAARGMLTITIGGTHTEFDSAFDGSVDIFFAGRGLANAQPASNAEAISLSLANAVVLLHSGSLKMSRDRGGRGTSFRVELPLAT